MWKQICCSIFVGIASIAIYMGVFQHVMAYETEIPSVYFFYKPYQIEYKNIGSAIEKSLAYANLLPEFSGDNGKNSGYMGLYYDNPNWLLPGELPRSDVGFYFRGDLSNATMTSIANQGYGSKKFTSIKAVEVHMPYVNQLSAMLVVFKAYSVLVDKLTTKEYVHVWDNGNTPFIEWCNNGFYKVSFPIGKEKTQFELSHLAEPKITEEGKKWIEDTRKKYN